MKEKTHIKIKSPLNADFIFCIDYDSGNRDKDKFLKKLMSNIYKTSIGYAGFKTKKSLKEYLKWQIFGGEDLDAVPELNFNRREIIEKIEIGIKKCHKVLPSEFALERIFVFPTFNPFVKNKMSGVTGFGAGRNTIHLFINPEVKGWGVALKETICHEFNHVVYHKYQKRKTLLDNLIFEGLAENFRECVVGGNHAPWVKALSLRDCKKIFSKLERFLNSRGEEIYYKVFFEGKEYPIWSGYAIGYHIAKKFLVNNEGISWEEILRLTPKQILNKSGFQTRRT